MFGLLSLVINAFIISFLIYAILQMSKVLLNSGGSVLCDISWMLERTPAKFYFALFMLQTLLAVSALAFSVRSISNHGIISYDILFITSMLLLVLYQSFKVFPYPPSKEI